PSIDRSEQNAHLDTGTLAAAISGSSGGILTVQHLVVAQLAIAYVATDHAAQGLDFLAIGKLLFGDDFLRRTPAVKHKLLGSLDNAIVGIPFQVAVVHRTLCCTLALKAFDNRVQAFGLPLVFVLAADDIVHRLFVHGRDNHAASRPVHDIKDPH